MEDKKHIIIDNGSGYCKVGFNGEDMPKLIPSYVGYPISNEKKNFSLDRR